MSTITLCSQFWNDFLPNFLSTILGLLLGIPIALRINRRILKAQGEQKQEEDKKKLISALQIIKQTLTENNFKLMNSISITRNNQVKFDIELDISAWDAVKDDIVQYLHDQNLKKRIAYNFSRLNSLTKLNTLYLDMTFGIGSTLSDVDNRREPLKNYLIDTAAFLIQDTLEILTMIETKLADKEM